MMMENTETIIIDRMTKYQDEDSTKIRSKLCEGCSDYKKDCPYFLLREAENKYIANCTSKRKTLWYWPLKPIKRRSYERAMEQS